MRINNLKCLQLRLQSQAFKPGVHQAGKAISMYSCPVQRSFVNCYMYLTTLGYTPPHSHAINSCGNSPVHARETTSTWQPQLAAHNSCIHDTPVRVTHCTPLPIMKDLNTAIRLPITTNQSDCSFLSRMVGICDNTSKHSVHHRLK